MVTTKETLSEIRYERPLINSSSRDDVNISNGEDFL